MSYSVLNEQKIASNDFLRYVKSCVSEMDSVRIVGRNMLLCFVTLLNVGQSAFPVHVRTVVYVINICRCRTDLHTITHAKLSP